MSFKTSWMVLTAMYAANAPAQIANYLGPGILSRGAGDVGTRGGQQVDLRFSASLSGIVDNGLVPISVNGLGEIPVFNTTVGAEARLMAYGTHHGKRSQFGMDYQGSYRYYKDYPYFNGSDQAISMGYTLQASRRLLIDMKGTGGTISYANGGLYNFASESFNPATSQIFDSRSDFVQGSMDVTYMLSPRTSIQAGGYGFKVERRNKALIGVNGYALRGSIERRVSRELTIGATFDHTHYDYPRVFGESDVNSYQATLARSLGRNWTINASAGAYQIETQGLQRVALDPAVAAILGTTSGVEAFYRRLNIPAVKISLTRRFKSASASLSYERSVNPGNGVYLTSRSEGGIAMVSYTGIHKWSFSGIGSYSSYSSVGQDLAQYKSPGGGVGATYSLTGPIQLLARYDMRHQAIDIVHGFSHTSYRMTFGVAFSPGDVPLSLW